MDEPTLTELRESAQRIITRRHHESEEGMLAAAFLALADQLAAVTAERDRLRKDAEDWRDASTVIGFELADLQQRIDAAPVWFVGRKSLERNDVAPQLFSRQVSLVGGKTIPVRLVRDDQPGE